LFVDQYFLKLVLSITLKPNTGSLFCLIIADVIS